MKRSKHSLSHYHNTTFNQGQLLPVGCVEVLPGDTFRHSTAALLRVSPLASPVMHPVHVSVHSWYVPSRVLWDGFEDFITGVDTATPLPSITVTSGDADAVALARSLGVGYGSTTIDLNSLPFRAYNLIWNEFYRDQDLDTALTVPVGDSDDVANYAIQNVSWEKDYFTTARANPQQGADTEVVSLTLSGGNAPVTGIGVNTTPLGGGPFGSIRETDASSTTSYANAWNSGAANSMYIEEDPSNSGYPNVRVDLSSAAITGSMNINDWRTSMALQRIREHRNRFGSRYRDMLAFLGVRSSDGRLQRPEYLGGGRQTIAFSEVLSTADSGTADVGSLFGHGIAALRTRPYRRFFEEHGYVLTLANVRPKTIYQTQVPRMFLRSEYSDFWQKEFEMLGEQAVTNAEIYSDASSPSDVFGYVPRFDDYRFQPSYVSGEFRDTLDSWSMARQFSSQPVLNASFVNADPTDRIYLSTATDQLYAMFSHKIVARRLVARKARN